MANKPPQNRSIPKTIKSFGGVLFWFIWDWFWDLFNLQWQMPAGFSLPVFKKDRRWGMLARHCPKFIHASAH
jgi:hypothetical protein